MDCPNSDRFMLKVLACLVFIAFLCGIFYLAKSNGNKHKQLPHCELPTWLYSQEWINCELPEHYLANIQTFSQKPSAAASVGSGFVNESFVQTLCQNAEKVKLDCKSALSYCKGNNTSLANCEMDWHKITSALNKKENFLVTNRTATSDRERCIAHRNNITCFHQLNATHIQVFLNSLTLEPKSMELATGKGESFFARLVLPLNPLQYILVTGDKPDKFYYLNLYFHRCASYSQLLKDIANY